MHFEPLEGRRHFDVTVTEAYPGYFEIHGDENDNVIDVTVSQDYGTFTVDGSTYENVSYIYVYAGEGDDQVSVINLDGMGMIAASIDSGEGADTISLNFDGAIAAGEGDDTLYLSDSFYGAALGGGGADSIFVSGACVNPEIRGGEGNDLIDASGNLCGVVILGEDGHDTLIGSDHDDTLDGGDGHDEVYGGYGNDVFYMQDCKGDRVFGKDGTDILYCDSAEAEVDGVEYVFPD